MRYVVLENFLRQREQRLAGLPFTKTQGLVAGAGLFLHIVVMGTGAWWGLLLTLPLHLLAVIGAAPWEGRLLYEGFVERVRVALAPMTGGDFHEPFAELGTPPAQRAPLIWQKRGQAVTLAGEAEYLPE